MDIGVTTRSFFDYDHWNDKVRELNLKYLSAEPMPHIVIDDFLDTEQLDAVLSEFQAFEATDWINYVHFNEKKRGFNRFDEFPPRIKAMIDELNSKKFTDFLTQLTGIADLHSDESLEGGGMHQSFRGGFLNIHADFVSHHHKLNWRRRLNILIYLNKDWDDTWGGHLEFWDKDMKRCVEKIAPVFNRCVVFNTDQTSYHGHPELLNCPPDQSRRSIALYYFTEESAPLKRISTNYKARPQDASSRWLISLDNFMIDSYTTIKRTLGVNDKWVSKVLGIFSRKK